MNLIHKKILVDVKERLFSFPLYDSNHLLKHRFLDPGDYETLGLGWSSRICISSRFSGVVGAAMFWGDAFLSTIM